MRKLVVIIVVALLIALQGVAFAATDPTGEVEWVGTYSGELTEDGYVWHFRLTGKVPGQFDKVITAVLNVVFDDGETIVAPGVLEANECNWRIEYTDARVTRAYVEVELDKGGLAKHLSLDLISVDAVEAPVPDPEHSTYKFEFTLPLLVTVSQDYVVAVTFSADEVKDMGYDNVRFMFETVGPGDVIFSAEDSLGTLHTFTNEGVWGPASGFALPANYSATTQWTVNFSAVGEYTITFQLVDLDGEEVIASGNAVINVNAADPGDDPGNDPGDDPGDDPSDEPSENPSLPVTGTNVGWLLFSGLAMIGTGITALKFRR